MTEIFRPEGLKTLEPMGMVTTANDGATYAAVDASGRPVGAFPLYLGALYWLFSSATMFVRGVDKAGMFPLPIRMITRYRSVSHARIFGIHLFGVGLYKC
ncbi:MAG: hypothetical protein LBB15_01495 [Puniceicoccales bacterium]|jgi:hypothetical protein|nr:hypothetical protein [Puniceicoccales bacterium]